MHYIGKIWLNGTKSLEEIAELGCFDNIKIMPTDDAVCTMEFKGSQIIILLHLFWSEYHMVQKIRIYAHHIEERDDDFLYRIIKERLGCIQEK